MNIEKHGQHIHVERDSKAQAFQKLPVVVFPNPFLAGEQIYIMRRQMNRPRRDGKK